MKLLKKTKISFDKKFKKVEETPAGFDFFIAIHDFIECIEQDSSLSQGLSHRIKINRELDIPTKYAYLKQVYQGLEDLKDESKKDLGHDRYSVIRELTRIKSNDVSESNSFWKKREVLRKLTCVVYKRLSEPDEVIVTA